MMFECSAPHAKKYTLGQPIFLTINLIVTNKQKNGLCEFSICFYFIYLFTCARAAQTIFRIEAWPTETSKMLFLSHDIISLSKPKQFLT